MRIDFRRLIFIAAPFTIAVIAAGCGGGTSNFTPVSGPNPNLPFTASQTAAIASVATPLTLPTSGAFGGTVTLSAATVPAGESLIETLTNIAPSTAPALQSVARVTQSRASLAVVPDSQVLYVLLTSNLAFTQTAPPVFALTLPSADIVAGATYYLALYDPTNATLGWQRGFAGPATINGSTLTFPPVGKTFAFAANVQYDFAVYTNTGAAPSPVPTVTPSPAPTATPVNVTASATQTYVGTAQAFSASETGYAGAFTATAACTNGANSTGTVGTIAPASATPGPTGAASFTFTPAHPGTCVVTVKDASSTAGTITFTVSATSVGVN